MHLIIETPKPNLSDGMQRFHGDYAQLFNRRHTRSGHLFQRRYEAVGIEDDAQLWTTVRYIVNNPVEAGLCDTPERGRGAATRRSSTEPRRGGSTWLGCSPASPRTAATHEAATQR